MKGKGKRKRKRVREVFHATLKGTGIIEQCPTLESICMSAYQFKVGDRVRVTVERQPKKRTKR